MPVITNGIYSTRDMLGAIKEVEPVNTFLRDTFFPSSKNHNTRAISVDFVKGSKGTAAYVSHLLPGKNRAKKGIITKHYSTPYIKEKNGSFYTLPYILGYCKDVYNDNSLSLHCSCFEIFHSGHTLFYFPQGLYC